MVGVIKVWTVIDVRVLDTLVIDARMDHHLRATHNLGDLGVGRHRLGHGNHRRPDIARSTTPHAVHLLRRLLTFGI